MRIFFTANEFKAFLLRSDICQAKKHPSVPRGYKCVLMKDCVDSSKKVVLGPVKSTGDCGRKGLQALNNCVAKKQ